MIEASEREDYEQAIRDRRLEPSDFEVTESSQLTAGEGVRPELGTVTVKRKSTGAKRQYKSGHGTAWAVEFTNDLKNGHFG